MDLSEVRKWMKLTQVELAGRLGIKQSSVSSFEANTSAMSLRSLQGVADGLGCDLEVTFKNRANGRSQTLTFNIENE